MNELNKIGFWHEVIYTSPKGEIAEIQKTHNILLNESITNFLGTVFNISTKDSNKVNYRCYRRFFYLFMESNYTPLPTDTVNNGALELYEADYNNTLFAIKSLANANGPQLFNKKVEMGKDNKSVYIESGSFTFPVSKTITGVVLLHDYNDEFHSIGYNNNSSISNITKNSLLFTRLLSVSKFNTPMQVMRDGKITIKSNFILSPS